jgi:TetR/AcrR family transcriptional regulator, cholesterol catabolism regulator
MARKPADQSVNREDILLAAADVMHHQGYEATTMKDIAGRVNLTAASLYHHFPNKDALILAVLEGGLEHVIEQLEPIVESGASCAEKLTEMVRLHIIGLTEHTGVGVAMIFEIRPLMNLKPSNALYKELIARRDAFFARRAYFEALFLQVIHEGITNGEFRPVDETIFAKIMLGAQNWVAVWYRKDGRLDGESIANMIAENFLNSLRRK